MTAMKRMLAQVLRMAAGPLVLASVAAPCLADATLSIEYSGSSGPFALGDTVQVKVRMSGLSPAQEAAGSQAFVRFDDTRLSFVSAAYTSKPFGQHIIVPISATGDEIDMASGIDVFTGERPTSDDADLVYLTFETITDCGTGAIEFRPHDPPTRLTTLDGQSILPLMLVNIAPNPVTCAADVDPPGGGNSVVDVDDLVRVILSWGACPPTPGCCPGNANGDAVVDVDDLVEVILGWGACPP
jgi:hypothetical protein